MYALPRAWLQTVALALLQVCVLCCLQYTHELTTEQQKLVQSKARLGAHALNVLEEIPLCPLQHIFKCLSLSHGEKHLTVDLTRDLRYPGYEGQGGVEGVFTWYPIGAQASYE